MNQIYRLCHSYNKICQRLPYIYDYDYREPSSLKHYEEIKALERDFHYRTDDKIDSHEENESLGNEARKD